MQSTSSSLSDKEVHLPEVEVLLATFNGELYLSEFLESLCNQQGVKIHLRVSDDGSTDRTLEIIHTNKNKFASCKISSGPRKGPSANFFSLIEKSSYEFVALADQDDIWLPNHLFSSLSRLAKTFEVPSITFCAVTEFGEYLKSETVWPNRFPGEDVRTILTENLARGCTFVLNSKAINLIKLRQPEKAIMHDWWILLFIYLSGDVTWSKLPEVRYRIHENNSIGRKNTFIVRLLRYIKHFCNRDWAIMNQANELISAYGSLIPHARQREINIFLADFYAPFGVGRIRLALWPHRYRLSFIDELAIRLAFLLRPQIKREQG
jgi:glycosyltransferase involved in cell wall biosynthesis